MESTVPVPPSDPSPQDTIDPPISLDVAGQTLTLLFNTESQREWMLRDIRSARQRVWLETYIFSDDDFGREVADALKERAIAGVDVRVHYDAIGCLTTPSSLFAELEQVGARLHCYHSAWESLRRFEFFKTYSRRNHRKILVIDDRVAYFGGMNIADHSSSLPGSTDSRSVEEIGWRDLHVRMEGLLQRQVAESFERSWQRATRKRGRRSREAIPLGVLLARDRFTSSRSSAPETCSSTTSNDEWIRFFDSGPGPRGDRTGRVFARLLKSARRSLTFSMAYFLPVGGVLRALLRAAKRGVRVQVLLPGVSDVPLVQRATRYFYEVLLKRRIELLERRDQMLHSKIVIIDEEYVVLGSSNFDALSLWVNWEFLAVIRSPRLAAVLNEHIQREMQSSERVTRSSWRSQSWPQRLLDRAAWSLRHWL